MPILLVLLPTGSGRVAAQGSESKPLTAAQKERLKERDRATRAEPGYRQALGIIAKARGEEDETRDGRLREQARLWPDVERLRVARQWPDCRDVLLQVIARERSLFGETSHTLFSLTAFLGVVRDACDEREAAERARAESVAIQARFFRAPTPAKAEEIAPDEAIARFQQAIDVRREILGKDHPWVGFTLVDRALAEERAGRADRAEATLQESQRLFRFSTFEPETFPLGPTNRCLTDASFHLLRLRLEQEKGDLTTWVPSEFASRRKEAQQRCDEVDRSAAQGDAARARALGKELLAAVRRILWDESRSRPVASQLEMARLLRPVLDRSLSYAGPEAHYLTLLNQKGSVFLHQRRIWLERRHPWMQPAFEALDDVNARLAALRDGLAGGGDGAGRAERLLVARKMALEAELGRRHARLGMMFQPAPPDVLLPAGAVLVDYYIYDRFSGRTRAEPWIACFVSRKGLSTAFLDLGAAEPVAAALAKWRRALVAGSGERGGTAANANDRPQAILRKHLWEPLQSHLDKAEVVLVSPDGLLCSLPFAALPGGRPGTYLLEEVALTVAPTPLLLAPLKSSTEMMRLGHGARFSTGPRPPLADGLLLVGDVTFRSAGATGPTRFRPLPGTAKEVRAISEIFRQSYSNRGSELLTEGRATKDAVRRELPRHRWAHLATHGFFAVEGRDAALPPEMRSALALAGADGAPGKDAEGFLTALEVQALDLAEMDLAVLSACETGLGEARGGEGVLGLQRAFQIAGARAVVASLWTVPDEATRVLMERLYRNLWERKMSKLAALREAQLWMLREGKAHPGVARSATRDDLPPVQDDGRLPPYYWAAFVLSGDGR